MINKEQHVLLYNLGLMNGIITLCITSCKAMLLLSLCLSNLKLGIIGVIELYHLCVITHISSNMFTISLLSCSLLHAQCRTVSPALSIT